MSKYDVERFRDQIIELVQDKLDDKINEINIEKADNIKITSIATNRWYNEIMGQTLNGFPVIWFGIDRLDPKPSAGSRSLIEVTVFICLIFNNLNQINVETKALRYTRILREIILENFKITSNSTRLEVTQFAPHEYELNDGGDFKIAGIHVTGTITG